MFARFARTMYRRRRRVVAAWLVVLVFSAVAASQWGGEHRADYRIPGSESAAASELLTTELPELSGDTVQVVVHAAAGITDPAVAPRIAALSAEVAGLAHVRGVQPPMPSADGRTALLTVQLDAAVERVPVSAVKAIVDTAAAARGDGLQVEAGGMAVQNVEGSEPGSEQIGMAIALLILLVAFGSLLAAGIPIVIAALGVGVALAVGQLLNHVVIVPDWAPQLVSMIGIGVGIDYALFVVVRYRSALAAGLDPEDAVVEALCTSGRAVLFAGGTVMISLLGLCAMGLDYLYGTAAVMTTGVLVVLVASLTLLPAMLGFVGRKIDRLRIPFVGRDRGGDGLWARWSRVVQRKPLVTGAVALAALVALAAPFAGLRFGYPDGGSGSTELTSRRAYDLVAEGFGPGANGPLILAVDTRGDAGVIDRVTTALGERPEVAGVLPPVRNAAGDVAALVVIPSTGPQDSATERTIHLLRDRVVPAAVGNSPARVLVGGATASYVDESEYTSGRLPLFIGAVIALSFVLLLVVFRAVLVAFKAAVMNLLAIGAAYGVMAMALKGGWLGHLVGIEESTPIPAWAPMMMFALLFGLSMDYEVFLLSRIREEYERSGDNAAAVARGLASTGRVISAAAAIMVTVFAAFMLSDSVLVKVIGLGLSVAVALDATLVRMVLVPSTMELLGDRNWWMPRWLDRLLPHVDIEGAAALPDLHGHEPEWAELEGWDREPVGVG